MMPGNNGGFHSSFANNSVGGTANYPQSGMWPANQFQSGQFGNSGGGAAAGGGNGGGHNQSQTNMSGFQCYNSTNNGFQAMPPQQQQQWQHHQSNGSWSGQQWSQNLTRPNGAQGQGQGLPQMKTGDSYQRTCDYVQKCKAWTGQGGVGGGGGGGSGESA